MCAHPHTYTYTYICKLYVSEHLVILQAARSGARAFVGVGAFPRQIWLVFVDLHIYLLEYINITFDCDTFSMFNKENKSFATNIFYLQKHWKHLKFIVRSAFH